MTCLLLRQGLRWLSLACQRDAVGKRGRACGLQGSVGVQSPALTRDGKPSVIVNYEDVENPVWRPLRDEVRRVGTSSNSALSILERLDESSPRDDLLLGIGSGNDHTIEASP